jgi:hypothetical protein
MLTNGLWVYYSKEDSFIMAMAKSIKFVTKPKRFTIQDIIFVNVALLALPACYLYIKLNNKSVI